MSIEKRLTDDADYLLCVLYDAYKQRRKNGMAGLDAKIFGGSEYIQGNYIPQWPTFDIDEAARELSRHELAVCLFGDDGLSMIALESDGISFMEHRFSGKLESLSERILFLRNLLFP